MTRAVLVYAKKPGLRFLGVAKGHGADRIQEWILLVQQFQIDRLFDGEFDSGSERTLAALIRHASRTEEC